MSHNLGGDILGGYIGSVGTMSTSYIGAPGQAEPSMGNPFGNVGANISALTRVILHIAAFWILSIAVLIGLHKAGFRYSITVGG